MHNHKLKQNQLSEAELIKGRNGISLFNDWHQSKEPEDDSREEITRSYRVRGDY